VRFRKSGAAVAGAVGYLVGMTHGDFIEGEPEEELDLADLVLKKSSEAEKIEELMERYPETVVQILRSWLTEDN
jgi:flagellar biosynthesis/type III secretory pathway M-ring protein FliF/YscJ